jgi:hypothetical protein
MAEKTFTSRAIVPARRRIEENFLDQSLGILYFDKDNAYPQRCRAYVNASGSAKPCVEMFISYIIGNGFRDVKLSNIVINSKGETTDDLLASVGDNMGYHDGYYVHVNYNALYQKTSFAYVPYSHVRYMKPEEGSSKITKVALYNDWAKNKHDFIDEDDLQIIDLYNPDPKVIQAQVEKAGGWANYKGQIFADPIGYTLPIYDCVQEDLITDTGIKLFKQSTVESGFAASHVYIHKGKLDKKGREELEEELEEMQDPEAAGSIFLVIAEKADQVPELKPIERNYDDKLHTITRKTTKDDIIGAFIIPPVLLLQTPGKLGAPDYNEAVDIYNYNTAKYRLRLERSFKKLFSNSAIPGLISNDYSIQPVGGIQTGLGIKESLIPQYITLMAGAGSPEYKKQTLIDIFGVSEDIATRLTQNAANSLPNQ